MTLNFPFFGAFAFWAQFVFVGVYAITFLTGLIRTPHLRDMSDDDEDAETDEEESLLRGTSRRANAAWEDIRGQAGRNTDYGTNGNGRGLRDDI